MKRPSICSTREGNFNLEDFEYKVNKLLRIQDRLVIIINTPANNPTGYSLSDEDWDGVVRVLNSTDPAKKVALVADVAYIDFAGDEKEVRSFLPKLEELNSNILPMLAYSASKTSLSTDAAVQQPSAWQKPRKFGTNSFGSCPSPHGQAGPTAREDRRKLSQKFTIIRNSWPEWTRREPGSGTCFSAEATLSRKKRQRWD